MDGAAGVLSVVGLVSSSPPPLESSGQPADRFAGQSELWEPKSYEQAVVLVLARRVGDWHGLGVLVVQGGSIRAKGENFSTIYPWSKS
jgi:hypothetical protein